jgi:hypothetical protein
MTRSLDPNKLKMKEKAERRREQRTASQLRRLLFGHDKHFGPSQVSDVIQPHV